MKTLAAKTVAAFLLSSSPYLSTSVPRIFLALFLLSASGCAGYQLGNRSLYPSDIRTVYVPMFESDSFRPFLGERLTEAVCKEIELRTPYKVVSSPNADSVLSGRIGNDTKRVIVENEFDDAREVELNLQVQVTWADRKGGLIQQGTMPVASAVADLGQSAELVPEYGESVATAQQRAIERLAEQIVSLMEMPW